MNLYLKCIKDNPELHIVLVEKQRKITEIKNNRRFKNFQQDMTYGDFKDLTRRMAFDKILCYKAFNIAKNPKYEGYQKGLASMVFKSFDKKHFWQ